jgi:hypothetical protein
MVCQLGHKYENMQANYPVEISCHSFFNQQRKSLSEVAVNYEWEDRKTPMDGAIFTMGVSDRVELSLTLKKNAKKTL